MRFAILVYCKILKNEYEYHEAAKNGHTIDMSEKINVFTNNKQIESRSNLLILKK